MRQVVFQAMVAAASLLAAPSLAAGQVSPPAVEGLARAVPTAIVPAQYDGAPTTGSRHAKRDKKATPKQETKAGVPEMDGATRENADKVYRKKYGF